MQLFYTGADFFQASQINIDKSLGGFLSSTVIPNDLVNNLFSDISRLGQERGYTETKGIVLKNTTSSNVSMIELYQTYPTNCLVKLEWAAVTLVGGQQMEKIGSMRSTPYIGTFYEPNGIANRIMLSSSLSVGSAIGLWVRRKIISPPAIDSIPADQLESYVASLNNKETIDITLSWT